MRLRVASPLFYYSCRLQVGSSCSANSPRIGALSQFWSAPDNAEALRVIQEQDRFGSFSAMATEAITAATAYDQNATKGIGAQADKNEFIARTLQQSIVTAQTRV